MESDRGVSFLFGGDALNEFLDKNGYELIVRGHQVVEDGYEFFADRKLVTLFSAPNYCGEFDNCGALMIISEDMTCSFQVFQPVARRRESLIKQHGGKFEETKALEKEDKFFAKELSVTLEIENVTRKATSWGDVWEDLFYDDEQLAEFKYSAFMDECGDDDDDW